MTALDWYILAVVTLGAIPATVYPLAYARRPWRESQIGRGVMLVSVSLALLFDVPLVGFWFPFPGYDYLYAAIVTLVVVGVTYHCAVLLRTGRHSS